MEGNDIFYKIKLVNRFEKSGSIFFTEEFSELSTIFQIKKFLQSKIYQKTSKIFIFKLNQNQEYNQLSDNLKIKDLNLNKKFVLNLFFTYDLPESIIQIKI